MSGLGSDNDSEKIPETLKEQVKKIFIKGDCYKKLC